MKIAVVGGNLEKIPENYCPPCGVCRQVMKEFCTDDFEVIMAKSAEDYIVMTLNEILPAGFDNK